MNLDLKVAQLRSLIESTLTPLIDADYIYLDLPYHENPGDILIWEGTEQFLKKIPHQCLYKSSWDTYKPQEISDDTIIIMHGGGNFGDLWSEHQKFRLSIILQYPQNKIIILPQSVYYNDRKNLKRDAIIMRNHPNLIICARDKASYKTLIKKSFSDKIILLPDMAFCIPDDILQKYQSPNTNNATLFVKRTDKELLCPYVHERKLRKEQDLNTQDWPSYEHPDDDVLVKFWELKAQNKEPEYIAYATEILRPYLFKQGVMFISSYNKIYTTRLHVAILCVLLRKPVYIFDNSYGKNRTFYEAWLSNVENINFIYHTPFERILISLCKLFSKINCL